MNAAAAVDRYLAIWNETDAAARRALIAQTFTDDAEFTDPLVEVKGADAIDSTIAGVQSQFTGLTFRLGGAIDAHHNIARFTWELAPADDAEALAIGFDVAEFADDGRMKAIYGFLDKVPSA
jgi:hypothetical protein